LVHFETEKENVDYLLHLRSLRYWGKPMLQYVSKSPRHWRERLTFILCSISSNSPIIRDARNQVLTLQFLYVFISFYIIRIHFLIKLGAKLQKSSHIDLQFTVFIQIFLPFCTFLINCA